MSIRGRLSLLIVRIKKEHLSYRGVGFLKAWTTNNERKLWA